MNTLKKEFCLNTYFLNTWNISSFSRKRIKSWNALCELKVAQLCPTLCDPMDYSLPGSSVHRVLQVRILEWVAIAFFRGSSQPRDQTQVSHITDSFTIWVTREVPQCIKIYSKLIILCNFLLRSNLISRTMLWTKENKCMVIVIL